MFPPTIGYTNNDPRGNDTNHGPAQWVNRSDDIDDIDAARACCAVAVARRTRFGAACAHGPNTRLAATHGLIVSPGRVTIVFWGSPQLRYCPWPWHARVGTQPQFRAHRRSTRLRAYRAPILGPVFLEGEAGIAVCAGGCPGTDRGHARWHPARAACAAFKRAPLSWYFAAKRMIRAVKAKS